MAQQAGASICRIGHLSVDFQSVLSTSMHQGSCIPTPVCTLLMLKPQCTQVIEVSYAKHITSIHMCYFTKRSMHTVKADNQAQKLVKNGIHLCMFFHSSLIPIIAYEEIKYFVKPVGSCY